MASSKRLALMFVMSGLILPPLGAVSSAQEFDWNDDLLFLRDTDVANSSDDRGLPGVRANPLADGPAAENCNGISLSELFNGRLSKSKDCRRRSVGSLDLDTDGFGGSSR